MKYPFLKPEMDKVLIKWEKKKKKKNTLRVYRGWFINFLNWP